MLVDSGHGRIGCERAFARFPAVQDVGIDSLGPLPLPSIAPPSSPPLRTARHGRADAVFGWGELPPIHGAACRMPVA